jgi:hypothetical protein
MLNHPLSFNRVGKDPKKGKEASKALIEIIKKKM